MAETLLEMARRHLAEGEDRIWRQEELIGRLERGGHERLLPAARELLAAMCENQELVKRHLWEIEQTSRYVKVDESEEPPTHTRQDTSND